MYPQNHNIYFTNNEHLFVYFWELLLREMSMHLHENYIYMYI